MSTFILKIIAVITMTIDHTGMLLCGNETWMRAVGRIAFPLYAFFIAEGFRHTKNRLRYFLDIFVLGQLCQFAYEIVMPIPNRKMNILITFSLDPPPLSVGTCKREPARSCRFRSRSDRSLRFLPLYPRGLRIFWRDPAAVPRPV